ncbi:MAG: hypothetical protein NVSMB2_03500 [Chloroflexota bacterium]
MNGNPLDEHSAEFERAAGLSALGVIDGEERTRFEAHVRHCERCQVMVRLDAETLRALTLSAPEMDPSPDFKARLLRRAAAELGQTSAAGSAAPAPDVEVTRSTEPIPLRPSNVIPFYRRSRTLSALAAVFVLALVSAGALSYENQPVAEVPLHGEAPGDAVVIVRRSGAAAVEMRNVPDPEPGYVYEAWIIPPEGRPVAAGVVTNGNGTIPLEGDPRGKTVAITREPGRVPNPTSKPLMVGALQS